jgi:hypothetical protein
MTGESPGCGGYQPGWGCQWREREWAAFSALTRSVVGFLIQTLLLNVTKHRFGQHFGAGLSALQALALYHC